MFVQSEAGALETAGTSGKSYLKQGPNCTSLVLEGPVPGESGGIGKNAFQNCIGLKCLKVRRG
jgi:hypothetical protein